MDNATDSPALIDVPVYGLPGRLFHVIHISALIALPITTIFSIGVIIYILRPIRRFFTRAVSDRIIVYLAFCDLFHSIGLTIDHVIVFTTHDHPPDIACTILAFFMNEFVVGQSLVVVYAALNAFTMVVLQKRLETGRWDWRLLLCIFGIPTVAGILGVSTGYFGPSGAWCYVNLRTPFGRIIEIVITSTMLATFAFIVACYLGIWLKIRQVARTNTGNKKYHKTAQVMMLVVVAFITQWWAAVTYATWGMFGEPHAIVMWGCVVFSNLGGLFNFLAYTYIRRKHQKVDRPVQTQTVAASNNISPAV